MFSFLGIDGLGVPNFLAWEDGVGAAKVPGDWELGFIGFGVTSKKRAFRTTSICTSMCDFQKKCVGF